jgi:hypothetical protein
MNIPNRASANHFARSASGGTVLAAMAFSSLAQVRQFGQSGSFFRGVGGVSGCVCSLLRRVGRRL